MGSVSTPGFPAWPEDADHEVMVFVLPQARIDFGALTKRLRRKARANGAKFATRSWPGVMDKVAVYEDDWILLVTFQEDDQVHADLRDMAGDCYADHPRAAEMATCRCRIDIYLDPGRAVHVAAFTFFDSAIKWLKVQPGIIVIDPETGEDLWPAKP